MDSVAICLAALVKEVLSDEQRSIVARFALADRAEPKVVEAIFGVIPTAPPSS